MKSIHLKKKIGLKSKVDFCCPFNLECMLNYMEHVVILQQQQQKSFLEDLSIARILPPPSYKTVSV